jgi:hypothetical protein
MPDATRKRNMRVLQRSNLFRQFSMLRVGNDWPGEINRNLNYRAFEKSGP